MRDERYEIAAISNERSCGFAVAGRLLSRIMRGCR